MEPVESSLRAFGGDGADDKRPVYETLQARADQQQTPLDVTIPPRQDAKIWQHGNCQASPHPRDETERSIRRHGRKKWTRDCGYHRRSLAETTVFRYKRMIGEKVMSRRIETQRTEARIGCQVLNRMTAWGIPKTYKLIISAWGKGGVLSYDFFMQQSHMIRSRMSRVMLIQSTILLHSQKNINPCLVVRMTGLFLHA